MRIVDKRRERRQAKEVDRLDPKGMEPGMGAHFSPIADRGNPAKRRNLRRHDEGAEQGKPVFLPFEGKRIARGADGDAGKGFWKKRMLFCNEKDRD